MSTFVVLWHPSWDLSTAESGVPISASDCRVSVGDCVAILEPHPQPGIVALGFAKSEGYQTDPESDTSEHDYWVDVEWEAWLDGDERLQVAPDWPVAAVDFNWHAVHGGPVQLSESDAASILSTWRAKVPDPAQSATVSAPTSDAKASGVRISFIDPVMLWNEDAGDFVPSRQHHLAAFSVRQDRSETVFVAESGEVLGRWRTDYIEEFVWVDDLAARSNGTSAIEEASNVSTPPSPELKSWGPDPAEDFKEDSAGAVNVEYRGSVSRSLGDEEPESKDSPDRAQEAVSTKQSASAKVADPESLKLISQARNKVLPFLDASEVAVIEPLVEALENAEPEAVGPHQEALRVALRPHSYLL